MSFTQKPIKFNVNGFKPFTMMSIKCDKCRTLHIEDPDKADFLANMLRWKNRHVCRPRKR